MASANHYQANRTQRHTGKWWRPQNDEQEKLFKAAKDDVLCFLTINMKEGLKARYSYSRIMEETETKIDYKSMGFNKFSEFLYHIDDILCLKIGPDNQEYLFLRNSSAAAEEDISHISALVRGQSTASKRKGLKVKQSNSRFIPTEKLLHIDCERGVRNQAPSTVSSSTSSIRSQVPPGLARPRRRPIPRGRQRQGGQSRTHNSFGSGRSGNSVPTLKPVNAAAVSLVNTRPIATTVQTPRNNPPTLRPLQQQNQTRSTMRLFPIQPRSSSSQQPSSTPKLRPLSEIRKLNPPVSTPSSNVQGTRREQENSNGNGMIRPKPPSVPQLKPLSQILRNIPNNNPNKVEDLSQTKMEEDEEEDEYSGDESEEFEYSDEENYENGHMSAVEGDECDGDITQITSSAPNQHLTQVVKQFDKEILGGGMKSSSSSSSTSYQDESAFKFTSVQKELEATTAKNSFRLPSSLSSRSNKKIYKQLKVSQMTLHRNSSFKGTLLGADEWGFLFVKRSDPIIENSFKIFHNQRQVFYSNAQNQEEYRMDLSLIEKGVYAVAFLSTTGLYIRAKIAEDCPTQNFCIVFDIDNCEYYFVHKEDVYHIDNSYNLRHPQAIMVVLRNTENFVLTSKFEELVSPGFEAIEQTIEVSDITSPDPRFRVPIVSIKTSDGQDLYEVLKTYSPQLESNNSTILTSLTEEQQENLKTLELKGHVVSTISL